MVKIIFEKEKCIGCGACTVICPKFWEMGEDNIATLKEGVLSGSNFEREVESADCSADAAQGCPVQCIIINE